MYFAGNARFDAIYTPIWKVLRPGSRYSRDPGLKKHEWLLN